MTTTFDYEKISDYCWSWLCKKYNIVDLIKPKYKVTYNQSGGYYQDKKEIQFSSRNFWVTYKRKNVKMYVPMIECKPEEGMYLMCLHEMTHYIQHARNNFNTSKTVFSEIETTQNEIEFAKEHYPHLYKKLLKFPQKKIKEKKVITIDENIIKLEEKRKKLLSKYKRMFNRIKKLDSTIKRLEKRKMKNGN